MIFDLIANIASDIYPYIFSIIMFVLSSSRENKTSKKEILNKRLDLFYVPFYQQYIRGFFSINAISDMSVESCSKILDLFVGNIQYMGSESQALVPKYYQAYLNHFLPEDDWTNETKIKNKEKFDCVFKEITNAIFFEYKDICRKLKLPKPAI